MSNILVCGAASAIAQEAERIWAKRGATMFLVDRSAERLKIVEQDLAVRGGKIAGTATIDLNEFDRHQALLNQAKQALGAIDIVLMAHGTLGDQKQSEKSFEDAYREFHTNFLSAASLLIILANYFVGRGQGTIAVISSVAGDRGRSANYVYGSAKAALTIFTQGLRQRLAPKGIHVLTIKPGQVDTPMTAHMTKSPLWAKPEVIGRGLVRAIDQNQDIVWLPWFWRWIMFLINLIPEKKFKFMKF